MLRRFWLGSKESYYHYLNGTKKLIVSVTLETL